MNLGYRACALALAIWFLLGAAPVLADEGALSATVQKALKAWQVTGAQVVVLEQGKVTYDQPFGLKNVASNAPVDNQTRFEIGSITKQFTAAAILQLKEHGKLSLSDPLGKYVPQYARAKNITIEQLLWQVTGIPNYTATKNFMQIATSHRGTFNAMLAMVKNKPLNFEPGTKWQYSNTNYLLLGRIVEVASGIPWRTYVQTHIFDTLGMKESTFMENEANVDDMATGYYSPKKTLEPSPPFLGWAGGAGAIVSTATDMAKWDEGLFGGKVIAQSDLALMTSPGRLANGKATDYGFGWLLDTHDGQQRIWHNGGTFGFNSTNHVYPRLGQAIIVLENTIGADANSLASVVFDALHPDLVATQTQAVPGENPAVTARVKAVWEQFTSGNVDRSQLTPEMSKAMTPDVLAGAKAQFAQLGTATSWTYRGEQSNENQTTYTYLVVFSSGFKTNIFMSLTKDGKISGYLVRPA